MANKKDERLSNGFKVLCTHLPRAHTKAIEELRDTYKEVKSFNDAIIQAVGYWLRVEKGYEDKEFEI